MEVPRFRVELTRRAYAELAEIRAYISLDSPQGADRVLEAVFDRVDSFGTFPRRFPRAPDAIAAAGEIRHTTVCSYRVIYEVIGSDVIVHSVRHAKRRPIEPRE